MKKQLQLFLTEQDEKNLSKILTSEFATVHFINDNVWPESPDYRGGISECDTGRAYLYFGEKNSFPTQRRKTGDLLGPIAGCVIQLLRPRLVGNDLQSGRVAAGVKDDDVVMRKIVNAVWTIIRSIGTRGVVRPDGRIDRQYLVGTDARIAVLADQIQLVDRGTGMHFAIVDTKRTSKSVH